jgi:small-conductance mechanosensitive channel
MRELNLEEPRSVRQIVAATVGLYRRHPVLFATLAVAVIGPYDLAVLALTGYGPLRHGGENVGTYWLLQLATTALITPLISALHVHAVVAIGQARRPRFGAVALRGLQVLPVVTAAAVMSSIGITLGFLALIVPGILLSLRWAVAAQAAALERGNWLDALHSSRRLTATHYSHVFGLLLLTGVVATSLRLGVRAFPLGSSSGAGSVAVGIALDTIIASFVALTLALLYFDLQARPKVGERAERAERAEREYPHLRDLDP